MLDSLMPFTAQWCWQRDVPLVVFTTELLFKGYQLKFQGRNRRDEEDEMYLKSCDERLVMKEAFEAQKASPSPALLLSVTLRAQDLPPVSRCSFELRTKTGVVADFMYNTACLSRCVFTIFTLFLEKSAISVVCRKLQQKPRRRLNIKRCEK